MILSAQNEFIFGPTLLQAKFEARVDFAKWGEVKHGMAGEAAVHAPSEWIPLKR